MLSCSAPLKNLTENKGFGPPNLHQTNYYCWLILSINGLLIQNKQDEILELEGPCKHFAQYLTRLKEKIPASILAILHQNKDAEDLALTGTIKASAGAKLLWRGSWVQEASGRGALLFLKSTCLVYPSYLAKGTCKELSHMRHT